MIFQGKTIIAHSAIMISQREIIISLWEIMIVVVLLRKTKEAQ